ncbi:hypothetical protein [Lysobacter gummosus]|uniref:hypothetical protein n=1 Tax=Lysobacter gummosus TaxID=262324 RepID=UPI0036302EFF
MHSRYGFLVGKARRMIGFVNDVSGKCIFGIHLRGGRATLCRCPFRFVLVQDEIAFYIDVSRGTRRRGAELDHHFVIRRVVVADVIPGGLKLSLLL